MNRLLRLPVCIILLGYSVQAAAWVYPEHRRLLYLSIQQLSPAKRAQLDALWLTARNGYETRLSPLIIDSTAPVSGTHIDYASWAAIAGDHSCSPADMLNTILHSSWIFKVERTANTLARKLVTSRTDIQRLNALRLSDLQLLQSDAAYASRAGANDLHFLLPRSSSQVTLQDYFVACTAAGAPPNALQVYALLHSEAIRKLRSAGGDENHRSAIILSALADEAFALHFLQDAFAAGHAAGTWGKPALKKGTHDHYNEEGLEIQTWNGKRTVIFGDAWMKPDEATHIAQVVSASLEQFVQASTEQPAENAALNNASDYVDSVNLCRAVTLPGYRYDMNLLRHILAETPMPGLVKGPGAQARTGAELGAFFGVSAGLTGSSLSGGFAQLQTAQGAVAGLEGNLVFGIGLDGVLNHSGDGLAFVQLGWKQESASSNTILYDPDPTSFTSSALASAIPARSAYNIRIRMPYYFIPGDLLLAAPLLNLISPATFNRMAARSVNGGLLGWQSGIATPAGRLQFILGREVGISFFGLKTPRDFIIVNEGSKTSIVEFRSTRFEFPLFELTPMRKFTENQASNMIIQLSIGFEKPYRLRMIAPANDPPPVLKTIWHTGLRIFFNWRRYL